MYSLDGVTRLSRQTYVAVVAVVFAHLWLGCSRALLCTNLRVQSRCSHGKSESGGPQRGIR